MSIRRITPGFHDVLLTNSPFGNQHQAFAYPDGVLQLRADTDQFDLDKANNPNHILNFFLDKLAGPGQSEFADGVISSLRVCNGAIVPEPGVQTSIVYGNARHRDRKACRTPEEDIMTGVHVFRVDQVLSANESGGIGGPIRARGKLTF